MIRNRICREWSIYRCQVASIVDYKMREINRESPSLDINKLSILTAVNVTHDYVKLKEAYEKLEKQLIEKD